MTNQAAQTMPELKPCPFCGGEAERIDFGPGDAENAGGSCIACKRCQSSGPVEFGYKENFISNWNRRAAALSQTAGVAEGGRVCKWHQQDEGYDTFSTGCGHEYTVNDCTDGNVQLPYCPFCAKPLRGIAWNEDDDVSLSEALSSSAAAPAASGVDTSTNEAWAARAQEKIEAMDAAASVMEPGALHALVTAANAVLALVTAANAVLAENPADDGMWTLEQAVRPFNATMPAECANGCPTNQVCDYCQYAPQPSADAVRELVRRWRECAKSAANGPMFDGASEYAVAGTYIACADELESLLSGGSHA